MLIVILVFQLTGCAAMFHGTNDQVTVTSGDPDAKLYMALVKALVRPSSSAILSIQYSLEKGGALTA